MSKKNEPKMSQLGKLESAIMSVIWQQGESSVRSVREALDQDRSLAYTTVMTVMSRLAEKGLLKRRKEGRAYLYSPVATQSSLAGSMLRNLVERMFNGATSKAVAQLLESEEEINDEDLESLEKLIRDKRNQQKP